MPKIDFYILTEGDIKDCLAVACRLIEKAYRNRHRIYIHMATQPEANQLDEVLWTYRDDSFIPHNLYGDGPSPAPPVQIGFNQTPEKHRDILMNCDSQIPVFYAQFNRILELVPNNIELQAAA